MGFTQAIKTFFQKYVDFTGRASRSEYWWVALGFLIIQTPIFFATITAIHIPSVEQQALGILVISIVALLIGLATLLPSLTLTVRRLHDTGKSAWFLLIAFIPISGPIIMLVFFLLPSDRGENKYGEPPTHVITNQSDVNP
jgi:uncharacterized membrane protein YhaH (DUF805 family)